MENTNEEVIVTGMEEETVTELTPEQTEQEKKDTEAMAEVETTHSEEVAA